MAELAFVLDTLLGLLVGAFLLRVIFQMVRADFRNPLSQAIVRITNPLVVPLRRVVPAIGRFDTAGLVAVILVQLLRTAVLFRLKLGLVPPLLLLLQASLLALADTTLLLLIVIVLVYALQSWVSPGQYGPFGRVLADVAEPILRPFRRLLPAMGGLDLSPVFAMLFLQVLRMLLTRLA